MIIKINYNTVSFELNVECNSPIIQTNLEAEIKDNNGKRITEWFESFLGQLKEENNYEPFTIYLNNCDEYEKNFIEDVLKNEKDIQFNVDEVFTKESIEEKYQNIEKFIDVTLKSQDEIVKRAIVPHVENIERLRCNKVEVPVIATMSSGKSTLLNALIGQGFLHEDTGATTATTCTIKVNNELEQFTACVINNETEEIQESAGKEANIANFLKEMNKQSNENQSIELFLEGPVSGIDTQGFDFRLIDTPGPNSAKNGNHKEKTYEFLKDNQNLPIVLYVLDPEKMDSKDDDDTLKEIGEILKGNKQNLERIIFIYNKIDRENIEEKSLKNIIEKVVRFLEDYGITTPKIFPVSAEYAKFAQLEKSLSRNEKGELQSYRYSFHPDENYKGYELLEHSPLRASQKKILRKQINNGGVDTDLVYSGLAALKLYLEDYVTNHHLKYQYKELRSITKNVCKQINADIKLEREQLENYSEEEQIKHKKREEEEIKILSNQKETLGKLIVDEKMNDKFISQVIRKVDKEFDNIYNKIAKRDNLTPEVAELFIDEINRSFRNLKLSIKTTLESKMNDEIERYLAVLKNIAANKFQFNNDSSLTIDSFNAEMMNNISSINPHRVKKYENQKTERRTREVKRRNWFGQFFLGSKTEEYKITKTLIDGLQFYKKEVDPKRKEFQNEINKCYDYIFNIESSLKTSFNESIEKFFQEAEVRVYKRNTEFKTKDKVRKDKVRHLSELEKKFTI